MSLAQPKHPGRVLIVGVLVLGALTVGALFVSSTRSGSPSTNQPVAVVAVQPEQGQLLIPQGSISAQVRPTLTAQLTFDHTPIPQDQLETSPSLGLFSFTPGPDKVYREFPHGAHSITVEYWPRGISTAETARAQKSSRPTPGPSTSAS